MFNETDRITGRGEGNIREVPCRSRYDDRPLTRRQLRKLKRAAYGNCWLCDGSGRVRGITSKRLRACRECRGTGNVNAL